MYGVSCAQNLRKDPQTNYPEGKEAFRSTQTRSLTTSRTVGSLFAGSDRSEMAVMVAASVAGTCCIIGKVMGTPVRLSTQELPAGGMHDTPQHNTA